MALTDKFDRQAARETFITRSWAILTKYLERLDTAELIEFTDPRVGSAVVKILFDAIDKAESEAPIDPNEDDLPEIPEKALDEFIARTLEKKAPEAKGGKKRRAAKPAVPAAAPRECGS